MQIDHAKYISFSHLKRSKIPPERTKYKIKQIQRNYQPNIHQTKLENKFTCLKKNKQNLNRSLGETKQKSAEKNKVGQKNVGVVIPMHSIDQTDSISCTSTKNGGITYSVSPSHENFIHQKTKSSESEIYVLKCILLREKYLQKLKSLGENPNVNLNTELENLLDVIRISTVEVIEAISSWRKKKSKKSLCNSPFLWNGINYLLKIPSDLDFLSKSKQLVKWLGFPIQRNPFIVPLSMENAPRCGIHDDFELLNDTRNGQKLKYVSSGFIKIGERKSMKHKPPPHKSVHDKVDLQPYRTPVQNEKPMALIKKKIAEKSTLSTPKKKNLSHSQFSFVSDLDLSRIRAAEDIILSEESFHGRFLRNSEGKLVPAWVEERDRLDSDIRIDDGRSLKMAAKTRNGLAPFSIQAGSGHIPLKTYEDDNKCKDKAAKSATKRNRALGRKHAKRSGGELYSFPSPGKVERPRHLPSKRNRASFTEIDLTHRNAYIMQLENKVTTLQLHLRKIDLSVYTDSQLLGDKPNSLSNGLMKNSYQNISKEINDLEHMLILKKKEKREREKILEELQRIEKQSEDRRRAKAIERKRRMIDEISSDEEEEAMTLEDLSIVSIQKIVRGKLTRIFYVELRKQYDASATLIAGCMRGLFDRQKIKKVKMYHFKAIIVQRLFRGKKERQTYGTLLMIRLQGRAIIILQKHVRGFISRIFGKGKRLYEKYKSDAMEAVSPEELCDNDLLDLADVIQDSMMDETILLLPTSVLVLIQIVSIFMKDFQGLHQVTVYNHIGLQLKETLLVEMTWDMSIKFLRRSSRLLRYMQSIATKPMFASARKLHLPEKAINLYHAYEHDLQFTIETFRKLGKGSRCACSFYKWISSLICVYYQQARYVQNIDDDQEWLKDVQVRHKERRSIIIQLEIKSQFLVFITENIKKSSKSQKDLVSRLVKEKEEVSKKLTKFDFDLNLNERRDQNEEMRRISNIRRTIDEKEKDFNEIRIRFLSLQKDFNLDIFSDRSDLQMLQFSLKQKEFVLKRYRSYLKDFEEVVMNNDLNRESVKVGIDNELMICCCALGKNQGKIHMLNEEKKSRIKSIGGIDIVLGKKYQTDEELMQISKDLKLAGEQSKKFEAKLKEAIKKYEAKVLHQFERNKKTQKQSLLMNENDSNFFDCIEDDCMAQEEYHRRRKFVPKVLLTPINTMKPTLVCISNDLPASCFKKMTNQLGIDFGANFVKVSIHENFGIDLNVFQNILDAGQHILAEVDVGVAFRTRSTFLHTISIAKSSLEPSPKCICVIGSTCNRRGDLNESHLGVDKNKLTKQRDGKLKDILEDIYQGVKILTNDLLLDENIKLGFFSIKPSMSHILLLEALIIVLSPDKTFHNPNKNVSCITWQLCKDILMKAPKLQEKMSAFNTHNISRENLQVLKEYCAHGDWPKKRAGFQNDNLMQFLSSWIEKIVSFGILFYESGGKPNSWSCEIASECFDGIVTIEDAKDEVQDENERAQRGWISAYNKLLTILMQDSLVHSQMKYMDGYEFYLDIAFAFHKIFFFAQNKKNHYTLTARVNSKDIDSILAPNSIERSKNRLRKPPLTKTDLYSRLADLLSIARPGKKIISNPVLRCVRKFTHLLRESRIVSGHLVRLTALEDNRGELHFDVYLPQFRITLQCKVNRSKLRMILPNSDMYWEKDQFNSAEASILLRPLTDRLKIFPQLKTINDMGFKLGGKREFVLSIRKTGGVGRDLFSCVKSFGKILHITTVNEIGRNGVLRIRVYHISSCTKYELRISVMSRTLCLGGTTSDWRIWKSNLLQRLHIWPRELYSRSSEKKMRFYLHFDKTLLRTAKKIGGTLFAIQVLFHESCRNGEEEVGSIEIKCSDTNRHREYTLNFPISILGNILRTSNCASDNILQTLRHSNLCHILDVLEYKEQEDIIYYRSEICMIKSFRRDLEDGIFRRGTVAYANFIESSKLGEGKMGPKSKLQETKIDECIMKFNVIKCRNQIYPTQSLHYWDEHEESDDTFISVKVNKTNEIGKDEMICDKLKNSTNQNESLVFNQSMKVKHTPLKSRDVLMNVKVYESFEVESEQLKNIGKCRPLLLNSKKLRIELYDPLSCAQGSTTMFETELETIIGPKDRLTDENLKAMSLKDMLSSDNIEAVIRYIVRECLVIIISDKGSFTSEKEESFQPKECKRSENNFRIILAKSRKYSLLKTPPIWFGTHQDNDANQKEMTIIKDMVKRGTKIFRKAIKISGVLLNVTAFEIFEEFSPNMQDREEVKHNHVCDAPKIRFIAYHNDSCTKLKIELPPNIVKRSILKQGRNNLFEHHGNELLCYKERATAREKYELADSLSKSLQVILLNGKEIQLEFAATYSNLNSQILVNEDVNIETCESSEQIKEKQKRRPQHLLLRSGFTLPVNNDKNIRYHCIVSVYAKFEMVVEEDHQHCSNSVLVRVYVPNLSETCERIIWEYEQKIVLGSKKSSVFAHGKGESMEIALRKIVHCLALSFHDDGNSRQMNKKASNCGIQYHWDGGRVINSRIKLMLVGALKDVSWKSAYLSLNNSSNLQI